MKTAVTIAGLDFMNARDCSLNIFAILLSIIFISSSITYHLYVLFGSHCTLLAVTCISPEPIGIVND